MAEDDSFESIEVGSGAAVTFYDSGSPAPGLAAFSFKLEKQTRRSIERFAKAVGLGPDYDFEVDVEGEHYRVKDGDWMPIPEEAKELLPRMSMWLS